MRPSNIKKEPAKELTCRQIKRKRFPFASPSFIKHNPQVITITNENLTTFRFFIPLTSQS